MVRAYPHAIRKRPRKFHKFVPVLSIRNSCEECGEYCNTCMEQFQEQVDNERPGHFWRVEDGEVRYKEDDAAEQVLGRKLKPSETVIVKNGNFEDCRPENLEVVEIPDLDVK